MTVYTIAIVQNSQVLQYDQMHTALQTARNQASLETPLGAEELLTAHFNLAVLEDQKDTDISPDAQKSPDTTQDTEPSASAPDDQTYVKIPSRLDLETAFKEIKISQNIEKEVCKQCQAEFCRCPAFMPGTPCSSVSSKPTSTSDEQIPELVANKPLQQLPLPVQTPSDEEADREVAASCRPSEYYWVRSHIRRRHHYLMYNALDDIGEITQYKR